MAADTSVRAGKAFVELFADDSKLVAGMRSAEAKLKAFGSAVAGMGKKMMLGGAGIVGSLFGASKVYADTGSKIKDMSDRTGMGAVAIQELAYAAEQSGTDMATLEIGVKKMQKAITEAGQGAQGPVDALADLGLSAQQLVGMAPDQQLALIGSRLQEIQDPAQRSALAMELLGKSGTALLPMFEDLEGMRAKFAKSGMGMSAEEVAAAEAYGDTLNELSKAFKSIVVAVGSAVGPMLKDFAAWAIQAASSVKQWIGENGALLTGLLKLGAFLLVGGAALAAFGKAFVGLSAAIGVARIAMTFFAAHPAVAALMAVGLVVGAIVAATRISAGPPKAEEQRDISGTADAAMAAGQRQRVADQGHLARLEELSKAEKLNNAEKQEAAALIALLNERYGQLGISLDATTGKLTGLTEGQAKVKEAMFAAALAEVEAQILARQGEAGTAATTRPGYWAEFDALLLKRKALLAGQEEALTGGTEADRLRAASAAQRKAAEQELKDRERIAGGNESLQMELHHLKIEQIKDEYDRERASIQATYDEKRRAAEKAGLDIELVEMSRRERLANLDQKRDEKAAEEKKRLAETRQRTEVDLQDDIDRLKIDTDETLTPAEKARQQMEKTHEIERREMRKKMAAGEATWETAMQLEARQAWQRHQQEIGLNAPAAVRQSVVGTFSGAMAGRMGLGLQERATKGIEQIVRNTKKLPDLKPAAALAFG